MANLSTSAYCFPQIHDLKLDCLDVLNAKFAAILSLSTLNMSPKHPNYSACCQSAIPLLLVTCHIAINLIK